MISLARLSNMPVCCFGLCFGGRVSATNSAVAVGMFGSAGTSIAEAVAVAVAVTSVAVAVTSPPLPTSPSSDCEIDWPRAAARPVCSDTYPKVGWSGLSWG